MSEKIVLSVKNISKCYWVKNPITKKKRQFWALEDVSFDIGQGVCLGLSGSNGSGKSTLLKIISHIVTPTSGSIETKGNVAPLLDLGAGFHDELTGKENIYVYGSSIGIKRKELKRKLTDIVDFAGVGEFLETKLRAYSSGMKARLAFSVASALEPDILIADEILAVGDEDFKNQSLDRIEQLKKQGTTIIMVQHDQELVKQICDQELILEKGCLITSITS